MKKQQPCSFHRSTDLSNIKDWILSIGYKTLEQEITAHLLEINASLESPYMMPAKEIWLQVKQNNTVS